MIDFDNVFKVYEITQHIKHILEKSVGQLQIEGEVSNLAQPASGHLYFSLKDEKALIKCVFFTGYGKFLDFIPKNGDKVVISGKLTVYERDGQYQILVSKIHPFGKGLLHTQFEMLKEKLRKEGLFDVAHKKKLPKYPRTIGIITSETGAVLQDILNIISRRYPLDIYLFPAIVQGSEAAKSIIERIEQSSEFDLPPPRSMSGGGRGGQIDVIILCRGGGSFEDLFCFNDEALARAIFACPIPIISAVGHETDFTICDFVADVRAATPSEAAEIAVPNRMELNITLQNKRKQLNSIVFSRFQSYKNIFVLKRKELKERHPQSLILKNKQALDNFTIRLERYKTAFENIKANHRFESERFQSRYQSTLKSLLSKKSLSLKSFKEKLDYITLTKISETKTELKKKKEILNSLSPNNMLRKGYTMIQKDGKIISTKNDLMTKDNITILLQDGQCTAEIK